ncbi:uncharacterized protein LOC126906176 [Daktulosphaira vitifoliae]|uniref:uncharacterized protein LOC126906176 n=1 Tax=Daktulosphaira vitifoliae TaxID=58002 RepID=UPI0021AA8E53|nr:uncharacterized protein LOC126906176 [Daktulosphaira vitifoliae]
MRLLLFLKAIGSISVMVYGRGILPTKTILITKPFTTTTGLISSCAMIEEDVPVCKDPPGSHYRWSQIPTPYPENGFAVAVDDRRAFEDVAAGSTKQDERKWKLRETVTKTVHDKVTVWSLPETVVTYFLKGCSPTQVPFDLSPCTDDDWIADSPDEVRLESSTRVIYYAPPAQ